MSQSKTNSIILAGDIGGTKANLGVFSVENSEIRSIYEKKFTCKNYQGLEPVIEVFLAEVEERLGKGAIKSVASACFGIACTVKKEKCFPVNLPWLIEIKNIKRLLDIKKVAILNDLEANAWGISQLGPEDFETINKGTEQTGNTALISAGTGLGESILFWDGSSHIPFATEGGHTDFAPRNRLETGLLEYLTKRFGHVSYERVLSGPGLYNIYLFLRASGRFGNEPEWLAEKLKNEEPGAVISEFALLKKSELCEKALDLFISVYGAEAGNLALKALALGGVFIGGGIAPKVLDKLKDGTFMKTFTDKGRFFKVMSEIPVKVILNDKTALLGAAYYASAVLSEYA